MDTLNKGVMTQGIGNVSISAAGHLAEIYKYYQTVSAGAMFGYNIIVAGSYGNTDKLASKVQGYISYDSEIRFYETGPYGHFSTSDYG